MNGQFRHYATAATFALTMGRTHILAIRRGLVLHHYQPDLSEEENTAGRHYSITRAGELVRELLKEAGLWQEAEQELGIG